MGSWSLNETHCATIPGQAGFAHNVPSKAVPEAPEAFDDKLMLVIHTSKTSTFYYDFYCIF